MKNATSGNRTRASRVAGETSTTEPTLLDKAVSNYQIKKPSTYISNYFKHINYMLYDIICFVLYYKIVNITPNCFKNTHLLDEPICAKDFEWFGVDKEPLTCDDVVVGLTIFVRL